jgi:hypothetical protein
LDEWSAKIRRDSAENPNILVTFRENHHGSHQANSDI